MHNYLIAPSIVSADYLRLREDIAACESTGADWIHVDVMDGHFVPNITMGPFLVQAYKRASQLPLDVHLMIEQPERYLEAFAKAGASHLTVHVETCPHIYRTLQEIKALGCLAGVTLNPGTPASALESVLAFGRSGAGDERQPRVFKPEVPAGFREQSGPGPAHVERDQVHGVSRSGRRHHAGEHWPA